MKTTCISGFCPKAFGFDNVEISEDSVILRNQMIAREGVLQYTDGAKAKLWEDLERNIGRVIPVIDEHPSRNNGNDGLYSGKEKLWGKATIKACSREKELCADIVLEDGAPIKKGWSIGFPYYHVEKKGKIGGKKFDSIQSKLLLDHLAITTGPRESKALQTAGDSQVTAVTREVTREGTRPVNFPGTGNAEVVINRIAYDSLELADLDLSLRISEIFQKLRKDNDDADRDELYQRATVMARNEQEIKSKGDSNMPSEEKDKEVSEDAKTDEPTDGDSTDLLKLLAENAQLKAKIAAQDSIGEIEKKLKAERDSKKELEKQLEEYKQRELRSDIDSLIEEFKCESKDFDGKSPEFVAGALWAFKNRSEGANVGKKVEKKDADSIPPWQTGKYRWSHKEKKYVDIDSYSR